MHTALRFLCICIGPSLQCTCIVLKHQYFGYSPCDKTVTHTRKFSALNMLRLNIHPELFHFTHCFIFIWEGAKFGLSLKVIEQKNHLYCIKTIFKPKYFIHIWVRQKAMNQSGTTIIIDKCDFSIRMILNITKQTRMQGTYWRIKLLMKHSACGE